MAAQEIMAICTLWEVPAGPEEGEVAVAAQLLVVPVIHPTLLVVVVQALKAPQAALGFSKARMLVATLLEQVAVAGGV